jgi:flagellar motor protein MotB
MLKRNKLLNEIKNGSDNMLFGTSSYAESRPLESNLTEKGRDANRRIDFRFVLATPNTKDLNYGN